MNTLTEKQIKAVAKLLALEIPISIHIAYELDMTKLKLSETVEEHIVRKLQRGPVHTILGSMVLSKDLKMDIQEFNALDKKLMSEYRYLIEGTLREKFLPEISMSKKHEVVDFLCDFSIFQLQDFVDISEKEANLLGKAIKVILENKIDDFEL